MSLADVALPLIKGLPPEAAHKATLRGLKAGIGLPRIDPAQWKTAVTLPRSGLQLLNPIGLAAGFDKNADVPAAMARFGFGLLECGTVTPEPQPGNPKPRLFRLPEDGGVINRLGFNNHGLGYFVRRLQRLTPLRIPLGANVGANKTSSDFIADYERGIREVAPLADYITINISSPNTPGLRDLQGDDALIALLSRCGAAWEQIGSGKPVFLKVAPDLNDDAIAEIVTAVRGPGSWLRGLIVSNTTLDRPDSLSGKHKAQSGGLSGAPLMTKSTEVLRQIAGELGGDFDLIGCGGITSGANAYAKIRAGAHAVQLYTALIYHGPGLIAQINADLAACLERDGFSSVAAAVGADLA